jgi:hypothetical protein
MDEYVKIEDIDYSIEDRDYDILDLLDDIESGKVKMDHSSLTDKTRRKIKEKEETDELDRIRKAAQDNFTVGQEVKYKDLCNALSIPYKTSNSKASQLKQLSRVIELEKKGTSYIVKAIHGTVQDKPPREIRSDSLYSKIIQILLLLFLSGEYGMSAIHTQREWWEILGMVNQKYNFLRLNKNKDSRIELLSLTDDMTMDDINIFYEESGAKFMSIFSKVLERLEDASIIHVDHTFLVRYRNVGRMDGSDRFDNKFPVEIQIDLAKEVKVLDSDNLVLAAHNLRGFHELWMLPKEKRDVIYKELYEKREEITGGKTYNAIRIKYIQNKTTMESCIKRSFEELKRELNHRCRDAYQKKLDRKYSLVVKEMRKNEGNDDIMKRFYEKQSLLADRLISLEK